MTATPLLDRINARKAASDRDRVLVPVPMAVRKVVALPIWLERLTAKDMTADIYVTGAYTPRDCDGAA